MLREVQRNEKNNKKIQKLDVDFFKACREYIRRRSERLLATKSRVDDYYAEVVQDKQFEIENARRAIKQILDLRETKIIGLARHDARVGKEKIESDEVQNLLPTEKELYHQLRESFVLNRNNINKMIFSRKNISDEEEKIESKEEKTTNIPKIDVDLTKKDKVDKSEPNNEHPEDFSIEDDLLNDPAYNEPDQPEKEEKKNKTPENNDLAEKNENKFDKPRPHEEKIDKNEIEKDMKQIKFLRDFPSLFGSDGNAYGPFKSGETVWLPAKNAEILINKGKAVKMS